MNEQQVLQTFQQIADTLRATQDAQAQGLNNVVRQIADQGTAMKSLMEQNANFLQNETRERKKDGFIDTKAVGKPPLFSGKETDWPGWMFKFSTWIAGQYDKGDEILDWAASLGKKKSRKRK